MNSEFSLFFYGIGANLMKIGGAILIFFSLIAGAVAGKGWFLLIIVGIVMIVYGSAMRFKYKRNSGYIVHGGDR